MSEQLILLLLSGAGVAISGLSGFLGYLFKEEKKLTETLRTQMREDDQKVIVLLSDVRRVLTQPETPSHAEIFRLLQQVDARLERLEA
ncbi:MAG TPA: hypothetical protein VM118_14395 [Acidobacteriota bacterium]|nr:hypothetical protein [Acidobacteriota bacterium]